MRDPRAYLVRIVTRQALNRPRSVARRREDYVGEWLAEPLLTSPDVAADAVGTSPAAVRQIAHRARDHIAARRPRRIYAIRNPHKVAGLDGVAALTRT